MFGGQCGKYIPWTPPPNPTSIPVLSSSDGSNKLTRKRDPRLTCENFLAGRIPCLCPELDEKEEEAEIGIGTKRPRLGAGRLLRCQIPGCEVDISQLKGYHKRHRVCLRCANATSVFLDGQEKRYCQQCGKFHILPDFDEGKCSCRRKLERHNKRRRRKAGEFTVAVEKETQVDQLAEEDAIDDKAGKDETPNESEDGNVSPVSSHPGSQSIQSGSVKSFVTSGDTQMGGGKDNPRSPSFGDNKNAYSSLVGSEHKQKSSTSLNFWGIGEEFFNSLIRDLLGKGQATSTLRVDGKRVPLKWDKIKGSYQLGGTECGYYTMKFMREIVEACSTGSFENKITNLELKETYTQDELDGVRLDIIQLIQENGVFQSEANEDEF